MLDSSAANAPGRVLPTYRRGEEIASAATHGVGVLLAVVGLVLLVVLAARQGGALVIASATVYGATLVALYLASSLYHAATNPGRKRTLRIFDHIGIYLLIAGSYTPFSLVTLGGAWGWTIFGTVWACAIAGTVAEAFWLDRPAWVCSLIYILMGWIVMIAIGPLRTNMPHDGLVLLFAGGAAYTGGVVFYVMKRVPYTHAVWHLFVLAGSICHFVAIARYVLPNG